MLYPLILLAYFVFTGTLAEQLLIGLFYFKKTWRVAILGMFFSFSLTSLLAGAAVVFYKLNLSVIIAVLTVNFLIILALRRLVKKDATIVFSNEEPETELTAPTAAWWGVILYVVLVGYGFYLLYVSQSAARLLTPWQTIDHFYIYIFAVATLLIGSLVFSRLPVSVTLVLLIIHAGLLHSYLPLTHTFFYGADQWRHLAVEQRIVTERPLESAELSAPANTLEGKLAINSSGLNAGALAYSSFWGASALIARAAHGDLMAINKWLGPVLWSLLLPLLLFELGGTLGWNDRASLFLVWLSSLPFTWQAAGSLTLPVSFGFLVWLLLIILLLKRIGQPERRQLPLLLVFGLLSLFGYTLYLILFWLGWALAEAIIISNIKYPIFKKLLTIGLVALAASVLPVVELVTRYSALNSGLNWLRQIKQLVGNFTAWYLATGPGGGDIATGNIIFNQLPLAAYVANFFVVWRWWLVGYKVFWILAVLVGVMVSLKKQDGRHQWLVALGGALFLSYGISRYFLIGENIFTRRLDPVLALFFLLFVVTAFRAGGFFPFKKWFTVVSVVILSCAIAAAYSLGPDTGTVSADEYAAMQYVWSQEKNNTTHCVLADTYPLLALEAISSKDIIGGGFPISQYFNQPELTFLYRNLTIPNQREALRLTGAKRCAFIGYFFSPEFQPEKKFGNVGVWWYPK